MRLYVVLFFLLAGQNSSDLQEFQYNFENSQDLQHFVILQGRWTTFNRALVCNSQGPTDEIRWRRSIHPGSEIKTAIASPEPCGLLLADTAQTWSVMVDKGAGTLRILENDKIRREGHFDWPATKAIPLSLTVQRDELAIELGEDSFVVDINRHDEDWSFSLINARQQCKFLALTIRRPPGHAGDADESREIARSLAQQAFDLGQWESALERLCGQNTISDLEPEAKLTLNRWAMAESRLQRMPRIAEFIQQRTITSADGEVKLVLPFRQAWTATKPVIRRIDGPVLSLQCSVPPASVEVQRYDGRIDYWFGQEPKMAFIGGTNFESIARARFEDLMIELAEAQELSYPKEDLTAIPGRPAASFVISHETEEGRRVLHELYLRHRGNTVRFSTECLESDHQVLAEELHWLQQSVEFLTP